MNNATNSKIKNEIIECMLDYKNAFFSLAVFSGIINLLMIIPSIYMMQVYDRVISSGNEMTLIMLTVIMLSMYLLIGVLEWVRSSVLVKISAGMDVKLGKRVFTASFEKGLNGLSSNPSQVIADLATIRQFVTGNALFAFFDAPWLPIYVFIAFLFHPVLGLFTIIGVFILACLAIWNEMSTRKILKETNQLSALAGIYANNVLMNSDVIESMGMIERLQDKWYETQQKVIFLQANASNKNNYIGSITRFVRLSWQSLSLGIGALLVIENEISGGVMIACSILLGRALQPVEQAIGAWKQLSNVRGGYNRLIELLNEYPPRRKVMALPIPSGNIEFEKVSIAPPQTKNYSLKNISFTLNKGDVMGVIGQSGSGKSTLIKGLVGIWKASQGSIRIDGAELSQWSRNEIGSYVGYLPQDVELFNGTVAENISRFNAIESGKVIKAAKTAGIHELILKLPNGYDTMLGVGGAGLSGGQKQRIGLARAIYGDPSIVALDEPNANLDENGEASLLSAIVELKNKGTTIVIITHKQNLLANMDKILIMSDGCMQLFGTRDNVIQAIIESKKNNTKNK